MDRKIILLAISSLATFRRPYLPKQETIMVEYTTNLPNMEFSKQFRVQTAILPLSFENMKDRTNTLQGKFSVSQKGVVVSLISSPTPTPKISTLVASSINCKLVASGEFPTDHHIVAADFAFDMDNIILQERTPVERFKWGRLSKILLDLATSHDPDSAPTLKPKRDTPHTAEWEENLQLYQDLHHLLETDPSSVEMLNLFKVICMPFSRP